MGGTKKIAVVVRERQGEALRISGGLTLADNIVEVFVLDCTIDRNKADVALPLELVNDLGLRIYSTKGGDGFTQIDLDGMAMKLLEYDIVVPY